MHTQEHSIELLPEHLIDQIKAGEVIERVSTLLKEVLENSIDAGANKIQIKLVNNGLDLISIEDNGHGISYDNLPLAFARHATSKISRFEDIYSLTSFGFRGEALASIASISKVVCQSTTHKETSLLKIDGGHILQHEKLTKTPDSGTSIFIKDLFYNTPARLKFIKSKVSEKNNITKILKSFFLCHPTCHFTLQWDDDDKEIFPITQKPIERIQKITKEKDFYTHEATYDNTYFKIYLSKNSSKGNAHKNQFLFVNDRYVQDIALHKIIINSARHIWHEGLTGEYIAFLQTPADQMDINVHPNKIQVKFFKAPEVYGLVSGTIKDISSQLNQNSPATSEELSLPIPNAQVDKSINYKEVNFHSGQSTESYFNNIHVQDNSLSSGFDLEVGYKVIKTFDDLTLISYQDSVYILSSLTATSDLFFGYLFGNQTSEEQVPLLISRPFKIKPMTYLNENISFLNSRGFDFDKLDEQTLVLRSFPKEIQLLPYIEYLEFIFKHSEAPIKKIDVDTFTFSTQKPHLVENLLEHIGIEKLIDMSLLQKIEENDLRKLYGR